MFKKKLSLLLAAVFTLSSILPTFAEAKQDEDINVNIEELVSEKISSSEKDKIQKDLYILNKYGQNVNKIVKIDVGKPENIYNIKYSDDITSEISINENDDDISQLSIVEGNKHDVVFVKDGDVYLDNKKVEVSNTEENIEVLDKDTDIAMPLADRDSWSVKSPPFGKAADYSKLIEVYTCPSIRLAKTLKATTQAALITILFSVGYGEFGLVALLASAKRTALEAIALSVITYATTNQSKTEYLSSKTSVRYHKNGHYIDSKRMYVQKNSTRWYYGRLTKDKDKGPVITNYVCTRYY